MAQSPLSAVKFQKAFVAWWLVWASLQALLLWWLGADLPTAATDSIVFNGFTAGACLLLCYVMQFYLPQQQRHWYIILLSVILSAISVFSSRKILSHIFSADEKYAALVKNAVPLRWGVSFLLIACMAMICVVWYSFLEKEETEKRSAEAQALNRDAELLALHRQLQPHFLFNSLNSISALAGTRPEEARKMIQQLSDFLRGTMRKDDRQIVTLKEELHLLRLYLEIEQVRFGHRLQVNISITPETETMQLPSLILQPVVENAIKFGLYDTTENVTISISAAAVTGQLVISVQNPFDPATAGPRKGEGFGLSSVRRRLYLLFARNDLVVINAGHNLFDTIIKIPQQL